MPRKKEILIYKFDELSSKAKEVARDWFRQGALDHDWWDSIYEDAANIGLKITSFDTDRGNSISGDYTDSPEKCAKKIMKDHGPDTDTHKLAEAFLLDRQALQEKYDTAYEADEDWRVTRKIEEAIEELEEEFKRALLEDYLSMLKKEVEYQMSDEVIDENIQANEYEFTSDGKRA